MNRIRIAPTKACQRRYKAGRAGLIRRVLIAFGVLMAIPASQAATCNLDVDGNGRLEGTTDGLLIVRYLLGLRDGALITGALGTGASRTVAADIESHLAAPCTQAGWVGRGTGRLNDSGITVNGDYPSGNFASCPISFVNPPQDCNQGRDFNPALNGATDGAVGFNFTKISNMGVALPTTAAFGPNPTDWGCTYDNVTGLMWEIKATSGLRNQAHSYSWYSSDSGNNGGAAGVVNGGTCALPGSCNTESFVLQVRAAGGICGRNDWRLPHVKELESIANIGVNSPAMDASSLPTRKVRHSGRSRLAPPPHKTPRGLSRSLMAAQTLPPATRRAACVSYAPVSKFLFELALLRRP